MTQLRPFPRIALIAAIVLATAACDQAPPMNPQTRALGEQSKQANATLQQAIQQAAQTGGEPPRFSDPNASTHLAAAFNPAAYQGIGQSADAEAILAVCQPAVATGYGYLTLRADGLQGQALETAAIANTLKYQDEVYRGLAFAIGCMSEAVISAERIIGGMTPQDRNAKVVGGAAQMRDGVVGMLSGAVDSVLMQGISQANADGLLNETLRVSPVMAAALKSEQRQVLIAQIDGVAGTANPSLSGRLGQLRAVLATPGCGALCSA